MEDEPGLRRTRNRSCKKGVREDLLLGWRGVGCKVEEQSERGMESRGGRRRRTGRQRLAIDEEEERVRCQGSHPTGRPRQEVDASSSGPRGPLPEAALTCRWRPHRASGRRSSRRRVLPPARPAPRPAPCPPAPAPAASSASAAPAGDHNMAAALLPFWLLLLGPPRRCRASEQGPGRRFSQPACADPEWQECREGGGGARASRGRERGRPRKPTRGRRPGRGAGGGGGDLRVLPGGCPSRSPGARASRPRAVGAGVSASHLLPAFHFSFMDGGGDGEGPGGGLGFPGAPRNVPSAGSPRLRGRWVARRAPRLRAPASAFLPPGSPGPRWVQSGADAPGLGGRLPCRRLLGLGNLLQPFALCFVSQSGLGPPFQQGLELRFGTSPESRHAVCLQGLLPALPQSCHFCVGKARK